MDNLKFYFTPKYVSDSKKNLLGVMVLLSGLIVPVVTFLVVRIINSGICISASIVSLVIAIPLCILGFSFLVTSSKSVYLSGEEYDSQVKQYLEKIQTNPREYVGLDSSEIEEIEPISFEGYKFVGATKVRKDEQDKKWRSDLYERVIVFFTNSEVHIYKVFLNIFTGKTTEITDVLFYDDVVSVSTKNEIEKVGNETIEYITFNLVSKGGNSVSVAIDVNDNRQKSINAMRAMIKEKKTYK